MQQYLNLLREVLIKGEEPRIGGPASVASLLPRLKP